jgi:hypothetical protein
MSLEDSQHAGKLGGSCGPFCSESTILAIGNARATLTAGADAPRLAVPSSGGFPGATSVFTTRIVPLKSGSEVTTRGLSGSGSGVSKRADPRRVGSMMEAAAAMKLLQRKEP